MKARYMLMWILGFSALALVGCRKGDKGDPGTPASMLGLGTTRTYSGAITTSPQLVVVDSLDVSGDDTVSVYVCKASGPSGVPCDQIDGNSAALVYYQAISGGVTITGAPGQGYLTYSITATLR